MDHRTLLRLIILTLMLEGCSAPGAARDPDGSATLRPYVPATATSTRAALSAAEIAIPTSGPQPTPITHTVSEDETMIGIAYRYGISLEDLMAANPGVDPRYLSIGLELIIPSPESDDMSGVSSIATPVPVTLSEPACYRTPSESMWCLILASNQTAATVESPQAIVFLVDSQGEVQASEFLFAPLNRLAPGRKLPLAAHFLPPVPRDVQPVARLVSAFEVSEDSDQYFEVELTLHISEANLEGKSWRIAGELALREGEVGRADRVAVVVLAYTAEGVLANYGEWVHDLGLEPGVRLPFELMVFSLGPPIDSIEVLTEAQTLP